MQTLDVNRPGMPDFQFVLLVTVLCTSRLTIAHTFVYAANQFGTSSTTGCMKDGQPMRPPFLTSGEELSHSHS